MERILEGIPKVNHPREALVAESFAGVFDSSDATGHPEGKHGRYAIRNTLPPPGIIEHWRQVVVDVTQPEAGGRAVFVCVESVRVERLLLFHRFQLWFCFSTASRCDFGVGLAPLNELIDDNGVRY